MLFLLSLLACNPEHNPEDVADITSLRSERDAAKLQLAKAKAELESVQRMAQSLQEDLEGFRVVAAAYASEHKFTGNALVVCHDLTGGDFAQVSVNFPGSGVPRAPWIQEADSQDCGEPWVLTYANAPMTVTEAGEAMAVGF